MKKDHVIALDGPSGSGKSTVAKLIAEKKGLIYIDTGSMFRSVGLALSEANINFTEHPIDEDKIAQFFKDNKFDYAPSEGVLISFNGEDFTHKIREHHVSKLASQVSKLKVVRDFLADWQRRIVKDREAILDGRDIGTVIFPHAFLKVFLTASPEERATRRFEELKKRGEENLDFQTILKDIKDRDFEDMNRQIAPLKKAEDAVLLDTTGKKIDDIVQDIVSLWDARKASL
ncbi:MAG TPA: (d)CMP kinase [Bacteriovoracaceae bacterium]|nr:(d)CMP kinase [Bacteriovoracaceae bacterium]